MKSDQKRRWRQGKIDQWNWDWINSLSHENECPYYLTEREVGALLTFMDAMGWKTRWVSPTDELIDQDFISGLRDGISDKLMRDEDCPADPCEDGCIDYLPNSSFIRYEPNDPFRTPLLVPLGYTIIPWYTNALIAPFGVLPTDAMVNQLSIFGPALPLSGFPRFSFEFDGRGEVEIELVNVPAGGFCLVVTDENLFNVKIVNTSSNLLDVVSIAGILAALGVDTEDANIVDTDIIEIEIPDVGHHRIDVTFLPNFGGETLLGFGGGLRRVTLCGPTEVIEEMYLQRQSPEDTCLIEQSTDGGITWQEAWRMDNCCCDDDVLYERYSPEGIKETSPDGEIWTEDRGSDPRFNPPSFPPLPGEPGAALRCQSANNVTGWMQSTADDWIAKAGLGSGVAYALSILVPILILVVSGITLGAATPLMLALAGALASIGASAFDAAMTAAVYEQFMCIVYCRTPADGLYTETDWQSIKTAILSDFSGIVATFLHDQINAMGIAGLNNAARSGVSAGFDCEECACDDTWCYIFDFLNAGEEGWVLQQRNGSNFGVHEALSGWVSTDNTAVQAGITTGSREVRISRTFASREITRIVVFYDYAFGHSDSTALTAYDMSAGGTVQETVSFALLTAGTAVEREWTHAGLVATTIEVAVRSSRDPSAPITYSGIAGIREILVEGRGENPFGMDNC